MIKTQLCRKIKFAPEYFIESIDEDGNVTFNTGYDWINFNNEKEGEYTVNESPEDPGILQQEKLSVGIIIDDTLNEQLRAPGVFLLDFSDGGELLWGGLDNPAQPESLARVTNTANVVFYRNYGD